MKNRKLFSLLSLASVCGACVLAGCSLGDFGSLGNLGGIGGNTTENTQTAVRERKVTIADFESWESGFQLIRTGQFFGQIRVNSDPQFVKSGKQSAQIHPMGSYSSGTTPIMFFPTKSELFNFDHSDFRDAEKITFEFYNNEDAPVNVAVGLVTSITQILMFERTAIEYQALETGWNTVTYEVNISALAISADVSNIQGIYLAFENARSRDEDDAPDLYLDDVVLHRYAENQKVENLVNLGETEYLDFEEDWQKYVVGKRSTDAAPDIDIVTASDYAVGADGTETLQATSGDKVLRFVTKQSEGDATYYPGVEFASAVLQQSLFTKLTEMEYGATTFSFDIYNNSAEKYRFGIDFYSQDTKQRKEYIFFAEPYQWSTFSINLKDLRSDFMAANKNQAGMFENPGKIVILWPEYSSGGNKEFFVDNMHFEKAEINTEAKPVITLTPFVRVAEVGSTVDMPTYTIWDEYDLTSKATIKAFYKNGDEWVDATVNLGSILIDKLGEYKLVASCTNSLGNTTEEEYYFRGVEKAKKKVWATYDYADEASNIHLDGDKSDTNKTEWLEEFEGMSGVVKATAGNATQYGAGYLGFKFANQFMSQAINAKWDYFTIRMYIEADASAINLYSWNRLLVDGVKTGRWVEVKITKEVLNSGKTYVNRLTTPVTDEVFYSNFKDLCGASLGALFYTTTIKEKNADSSIIYYIDEITWGVNTSGSFGDKDNGTSDIYDDAWVDPSKK